MQINIVEKNNNKENVLVKMVVNDFFYRNWRVNYTYF